MAAAARQGDLFAGFEAGDSTIPTQLDQQLGLSPALLRDWQSRIHQHQGPLLEGTPATAAQTQLFAPPPTLSTNLRPLSLQPLPLSFWRWPQSPHAGAAVYLVMDKPDHLPSPILLYVGETLAADRRWKGEHDCKTYLAAYGEALSSAGLNSQPSIRFWVDVPQTTKARRQLEQELIQTWLPPFNKETRERWATPFNAD
jgi:hypothetical protein